MEQTSAGVRINSVGAKSAANKAGLKNGDIILSLNQDAIKTTADVSLWRLDKKPNDAVMVKLRRNNQILTKPLRLGKPSNKHGSFDFSKMRQK